MNQQLKSAVAVLTIAGTLFFGQAQVANAAMIEVKPGDTLFAYSQRYGVSVEAIKLVNRLNSDQIQIGRTLYIPPKGTIYQVVSGDTLWKLSLKYQVSVDKIKAANQLTSDVLYLGQKLLIPSTVQTTPAAQPYVTYQPYQVQRGDNAWSISMKFGIPMPEFLKVNGLTQQSVLSLGQTVKIPIHHIPVTSVPGPRFGEYLDWFDAAQYLYPIHSVAVVRDYHTGVTFKVKRMMGAFHADCEPLTANDAAIMKKVWGGAYSWKTRPVIVEINGRKIAASMSSMPHGEDFMDGNGYTGHFDIHFKDSLRHKDGLVDTNHQKSIMIAAGKA